MIKRGDRVFVSCEGGDIGGTVMRVNPLCGADGNSRATAKVLWDDGRSYAVLASCLNVRTTGERLRATSDEPRRRIQA